MFYRRKQRILFILRKYRVTAGGDHKFKEWISSFWNPLGFLAEFKIFNEQSLNYKKDFKILKGHPNLWTTPTKNSRMNKKPSHRYRHKMRNLERTAVKITKFICNVLFCAGKKVETPCIFALISLQQ